MTGNNAPTFAVVITCIDGRIQGVLQDRLRQAYGVDEVDVVTLPGPDRAVATDPVAQDLVAAHVDVSVAAHGSRVVTLAGHTECAAVDLPAEDHARFVREGAVELCRRFPGLVVVGVLVHTGSGEVEIVKASERCPAGDA